MLSRAVRSPSLTTCSQKQITPLYLVICFLTIIFIIGLKRNGSFLLVLEVLAAYVEFYRLVCSVVTYLYLLRLP